MWRLDIFCHSRCLLEMVRGSASQFSTCRSLGDLKLSNMRTSYFLVFMKTFKYLNFRCLFFFFLKKAQYGIEFILSYKTKAERKFGVVGLTYL